MIKTKRKWHKNRRKHFIQLLAAAFLLTGAVLTMHSVYAAEAPAEFDISQGSITFAADHVRFGSSTYALRSDNTYTITGASDNKAAHSITVSGGTHNIKLNSISLSQAGNSLVSFAVNSGTANLSLQGENHITGGVSYAGITVSDGATLSVSGTGSLTVTGGAGGAGIGGNLDQASVGTVLLNGGTVAATAGGSGPAPIGGGRNSSSYGVYKTKVNTVTLSGDTAKMADTWYWIKARYNAGTAYTADYVKKGTMLTNSNLNTNPDSGQAVTVWTDNMNSGADVPCTEKASKCMELTGKTFAAKLYAKAELYPGDIAAVNNYTYVVMQGTAGAMVDYDWQYSDSASGPWKNVPDNDNDDSTGAHVKGHTLTGENESLSMGVGDTFEDSARATLNWANKYTRVNATFYTADGSQSEQIVTNARKISDRAKYNLYNGDITLVGKGDGNTKHFTISFTCDNGKAVTRENPSMAEYKVFDSWDPSTGVAAETSHTLTLNAVTTTTNTSQDYFVFSAKIQTDTECKNAPVNIINGSRVYMSGGNGTAISGAVDMPGIYVDGTSSFRCRASVTATGGEGAAGIGGKSGALTGDLEFSGNHLKVTGGKGAAGIGSGKGGSLEGKSIVMDATPGGTNTITGGAGGAAVGSGEDGTGTFTISVTQNTTENITATGGGAGIGTGLRSAANVTFSNDDNNAVTNITADVTGGGAGIGLGKGASGSFTANLLNAKASFTLSADTGAGFGSGEGSTGTFTATISGLQTMTATSKEGKNIGKGKSATQTPVLNLAVHKALLNQGEGFDASDIANWLDLNFQVSIIDEDSVVHNVFMDNGAKLGTNEFLTGEGPWEEVNTQESLTRNSLVTDILYISDAADTYNVFNGAITINRNTITYFPAVGAKAITQELQATDAVKIICKNAEGNYQKSNNGVSIVNPIVSHITLEEVGITGLSVNAAGLEGGVTLTWSKKSNNSGGTTLTGSVTFRCATHVDADCNESACPDGVNCIYSAAYVSAMQVNANSKLTILGGSYTVRNDHYAGKAGIELCDPATSTLEMRDGYLNARGMCGAGIGGGYGGSSYGGGASGGIVYIYGGTVYAYGRGTNVGTARGGSAGIGGGGSYFLSGGNGDGGSGGKTYIYGGNVYAYGGGTGGAGIGSGAAIFGNKPATDGGTTYIYGGKVTANGAANAAGIGGGAGTPDNGKLYIGAPDDAPPEASLAADAALPVITAGDNGVGGALHHATTYYKVKASTPSGQEAYNDFVLANSRANSAAHPDAPSGQSLVGWHDAYTNKDLPANVAVNSPLKLTAQFGVVSNTAVVGFQLQNANGDIPLKDVQIDAAAIYATVDSSKAGGEDSTVDLAGATPLLITAGDKAFSFPETDFEARDDNDELILPKYTVEGHEYTVYLKRAVKIRQEADLNFMNHYDKTLVSKYVLTQSFAATNAFADLTAGNFVVDGGGHYISGLTKPLFKSISGTTVQDLMLRQSNVSGAGVGALATSSIDSTIRRVELFQCTVTAQKPAADNVKTYTGGVIGACNSSVVEDCIIRGGTIGNPDLSYVGGFFGSTARGVQINRCLLVAKLQYNDVNGSPYTGNMANYVQSKCLYDSEVYDNSKGTQLNGSKITSELLGTAAQSTLGDAYTYVLDAYPQLSVFNTSTDEKVQNCSKAGAASLQFMNNGTSVKELASAVRHKFTMTGTGPLGGGSWTNSGINEKRPSEGGPSDTGGKGYYDVVSLDDVSYVVSLSRLGPGSFTYTIGDESMLFPFTVVQLPSISITMLPRYAEETFTTAALPSWLNSFTFEGGKLSEFTDDTFETPMSGSKVAIQQKQVIQDNLQTWGVQTSHDRLGFGVTVGDEELDVTTMGQRKGITALTLYNAAAYCKQTQTRYIKLTLITNDGTFDRGINITIPPVQDYTLDVTLPTDVSADIDPNNNERMTYTDAVQVQNRSLAPVQISISGVVPQEADTAAGKLKIPVISQTQAQANAVNVPIQNGMAMGAFPSDQEGITDSWFDPSAGATNSPFARICQKDGPVRFKFGVYHSLLATEGASFGYTLHYTVDVCDTDVVRVSAASNRAMGMRLSQYSAASSAGAAGLAVPAPPQAKQTGGKKE